MNMTQVLTKLYLKLYSKLEFRSKVEHMYASKILFV